MSRCWRLHDVTPTEADTTTTSDTQATEDLQGLLALGYPGPAVSRWRRAWEGLVEAWSNFKLRQDILRERLIIRWLRRDIKVHSRLNSG